MVILELKAIIQGAVHIFSEITNYCNNVNRVAVLLKINAFN